MKYDQGEISGFRRRLRTILATGRDLRSARRILVSAETISSGRPLRTVREMVRIAVSQFGSTEEVVEDMRRRLGLLLRDNNLTRDSIRSAAREIYQQELGKTDRPEEKTREMVNKAVAPFMAVTEEKSEGD